ncbi:hypothetical protein Pla108_22260 [Botrimarina colliarenosi]|uniref:LTD domain-containing protein n=1 Tax=Botrimarina colliarenosi TaxID=2528001 RepID=A0A5C6AF62_9BACT|nr:lamin tail domain-containing protein [Botrimarina colliarenosi]TWT98070.1 hypothetical protein Pla108_22260 [Botrimarina colliarenosi]
MRGWMRYAAACAIAAVSAVAPAEVVFSEIMYNPDGSDDTVGALKEWVELYNAGLDEVDLSGWRIEDVQDAQAAAPLPAGVRLAPGEAIILTPDAATFDAQWNRSGANVRRYEVTGFPSLANSPSPTNETLGLRNSAGRLVDLVNFDDDPPWPTDSPDGSSVMLLPNELSALANDSGLSWKPSMAGVYGAQYRYGADGSLDRASPGYVAVEAQAAFTPSPDAAWSMVVFPDTQNYSKSSGDRPIFSQMAQWVVDHKSDFNIQFVLQEGDIVNQNSQVNPTSGDQSGDEQWRNAKEAMILLDGVVPYAMAPGNHDYGSTNAQDRSTQFNDYFKQTDNPLVDPAQGGALRSVMTPGELDNAIYEFAAPDGREMLLVTTEWGPRQQVVDWAGRALRTAKYADHTAILMTHAYMDHDETRLDWRRNQDADPTNNQGGNPHSYPTAGDTNDGEELWQELVSPNQPFEMVLSGHIGGDGTGYLASTGEQGQTVHQMLFNTQFETYGGNGWLRVLEFLDDGRTVRIRTYSPFHDLQKTDAANAFEFTISPLLPGDYNDDGAVDAADYTVWRELRGEPVEAWSRADGNGDGFIDDDDLAVWRDHYGAVRNGSVSATPEPSGTAIVAVGASLLMRRRRSRAEVQPMTSRLAK